MNKLKDPLQFNSYQENIINGIIFGDGYVHSTCNNQSARFAFQLAEKNREWVEFIKKELKLDTDITRGVGKHKQTGKQYPYVRIAKQNVSFCKFRNLWYDTNGLKILPRTIFPLNPTTALHLYLGDGTYERGGNFIQICTDNFNKDEVNKFILELKYLGFYCSIKKKCNNWRVNFEKKSSIDFLNWIGKPPINCMRYKWSLIYPDEYFPRQKVSLAVMSLARPINIFDRKMNFIKSFDSIRECAEQMRLSRGSIHQVLRGKNSHCGGFIFRYKNILTED